MYLLLPQSSLPAAQPNACGISKDFFPSRAQLREAHLIWAVSRQPKREDFRAQGVTGSGVYGRNCDCGLIAYYINGTVKIEPSLSQLLCNAKARCCPSLLSEWAVEEIVEGLKRNGFNEDVSNKFTLTGMLLNGCLAQEKRAVMSESELLSRSFLVSESSDRSRLRARCILFLWCASTMAHAPRAHVAHSARVRALRAALCAAVCGRTHPQLVQIIYSARTAACGGACCSSPTRCAVPNPARIAYSVCRRATKPPICCVHTAHGRSQWDTHNGSGAVDIDPAQQHISCRECVYRGGFQVDIDAKAARHRNGFLVGSM
ncbi:hypothetical protein DFH08DRAFT_805044 [Mycena albidolilacea]|uniref:Uncharacterized protein n=1 Tax=Mycena albidolilacea TaxID=1033008 RepID=A0AAD7ABK9_9AGAR|nr:hypothetical protein DFH08DRAFT_805044 [Mycena albidolilacea]